MFGSTGFHTWNTLSMAERKRQREHELHLKRLRKAHRKLDRRARLLIDLKRVDDRIKMFVRARHYGNSAARAAHLLRRHNRLVDALNAFTGTSQAMPMLESN